MATETFAKETFDVVVVGSGAAGASAALRAAELGLSVLIVEKTNKYGGTSATSGGVLWVPNHDLAETGDSREEALRYLDSIVRGPVQRERLEAYVDQAPELIRFLKSLDMQLIKADWADYFPQAPGARADRSIICPTYDGRRLGPNFIHMREQFSRFKLFRRYSMDLVETFSILARSKGWMRNVVRMVVNYWLDVGTRAFTARDRRFTIGAALMGQVYERVFARGVEVRLDTRLEELILDAGAVAGVRVSSFGRRYDVAARHGVVLGCGGFEWNQELRDRFFAVPTLTRYTSTPEDANRGEGLLAGLKLGAAVEHTGSAWWIPTMKMPQPKASNYEEIHQAAFDVGRPHSVCVNRNGVRFVDEACGYDRFGTAMVEDHKQTGANVPCWHVFDALYREKFTCGGFMPSAIMPDWRIPKDWWGHYIFKADTIEALARAIGVPVEALAQTVTNMNGYAQTGVDPEFGRGGDAYDLSFGDPTVKPNPCLGPIAKPPFYAVPINLGDLGTKGGLKADAHARVVDGEGRPIPKLYAAGNASGSPFGDCYPGAGGTIGPAMVFGFVAANDIAARTRNQAGGRKREEAPIAG
jgi:3-oxosteroid 1-dehydrogenase